MAKNYVLQTIKGDINGNWEVSKSYDASQASYLFSLFNFEATSTQYQTWMDDVETTISTVGKQARDNNLAINLLYWAFWSKTVPLRGKTTQSDSSYTIAFTGKPSEIMNLDQIRGSIANNVSTCDSKIIRKSYDAANGELSAIMSKTEFSNEATCKNTLVPEKLGFSQYLSGDEFKLSIDVTLALTAVAVNYGIIDPEALRYVMDYGDPIAYGNTHYKIELLYHKSEFIIIYRLL